MCVCVCVCVCRFMSVSLFWSADFETTDGEVTSGSTHLCVCVCVPDTYTHCTCQISVKVCVCVCVYQCVTVCVSWGEPVIVTGELTLRAPTYEARRQP